MDVGVYISTVLILGFPALFLLGFHTVSSLNTTASPHALGGGVVYLSAVVAAELVTSFLDPTLGMLCHISILVALLALATLRAQTMTQAGLQLSFTLAPLTRIVSLALPLAAFPQFAWYLVASIPVVLATYMVFRLCAYQPRDVGLTCPHAVWQVLIAVTGIPFGIVEYGILRPEPIIGEVWGVSWALMAVALIVATGFVEEFAFRGVMQRSALDAYGPRGMLLVAAVFAALHIGWLSLVDVLFVFVIGLVFSYVTFKTGSLLGVAVSHGLTNVMLFMIMPFLGV